MKKKIQKPFNVEAAKNGAKVETKDGISVRIICYDRISKVYPIIALIAENNFECCVSYTIDGKRCSDDFTNYYGNLNLVIIEEIESKFNEGDYIVSEIDSIYKIIKIDDMYHTKQLSSGYEQRWTVEDIDKTFHRWSLNDAKPGSVLCYEDGRPFVFKELRDGHPVAYFGIDYEDSILIGNGMIWTDKPVRPATFKEYNRLFKQLREENYEYNVNTHEITKSKTSWRYKEGLGTKMNGYYIGIDSGIYSYDNGILCKNSYNVFATKKQAKSALAMARISQIMANDKRFGGTISYEEWADSSWHVILRRYNELEITTRYGYEYLAFHTREQADLFLNENEDLIKEYYMLD